MKIITIRGKKYRWNVENMHGGVLLAFCLSGVFAFIASLGLFVTTCVIALG